MSDQQIFASYNFKELGYIWSKLFPMKIIFMFMILSFFASPVLSQYQAGPRLIVRADDMGSVQASNEASVRAYKNGIVTSVEVMAVGPWFPEAVRLLNENPGVDVGLHFTITSEWDNIKWRPLTPCPGLTDGNGYFPPTTRSGKSNNRPSVMGSQWTPEEIEQEFRAQIELALRNIPGISHFSGHMGSTAFDAKVVEIADRLAEEYHLSNADQRKGDLSEYSAYEIIPVGYLGPRKTQEEKTGSFIKMLNTLEKGKTYVFLDHPAYNTEEMQAVYHPGYEDVAVDRQGVFDLFTSKKVQQVILEKGIELVSFNDVQKALPRSAPEAEGFAQGAFDAYLEAVKKSGQEVHSVMVLRHGKVIAEKWLGDHAPRINHVMHSVSKTFTATAIGFAVSENRLKVSDKVISFFPDELPEQVSPHLAAMEIRHLLTMSVGQEKDPSAEIRKQDSRWEKLFLATPILHEPGTKFLYNSLASYMLSAIITKVTGEKLVDYLYPRLFRPLGISGVEWDISPSGVNTGGWGLYIKTEDMAKMGQFFLRKGKWNGRQLLPEAWFEEATSAQIMQKPGLSPKHRERKTSDWVQGYGYQMWRCRHNAFRADGANGQFIIIIPEKDAVVVTTANVKNMQSEIDLIWDHLLPAFK